MITAELAVLGARVAYEDQANPRRVGSIVARDDADPCCQFTIRWDDTGEQATSDLRQHGWALLADSDPEPAGVPRCVRCGLDVRYTPPDYPCRHQLPPTVLRLVCVEGGVSDDDVRERVPSWQPGRLLAEYDPAVGVDSILLTDDLTHGRVGSFGLTARHSASASAAVSKCSAADGRPNRPLSAFTVEPMFAYPGRRCATHNPTPTRRGGPLRCSACGSVEHPRICHDPESGELACCCGLEDGLLREAERIGERIADAEARR